MIKTFNSVTCDICKTTVYYYEENYDCFAMWVVLDTGERITPWRSRTMNVKFLTDKGGQILVAPKFDKVEMDICPNCLKKLLDKWPIVAYGGQGHYQYELKD